jgi:hypothetical protein
MYKCCTMVTVRISERTGHHKVGYCVLVDLVDRLLDHFFESGDEEITESGSKARVASDSPQASDCLIITKSALIIIVSSQTRQLSMFPRRFSH